MVLRTDYADFVDTWHGADANATNTQVNTNTTDISTNTAALAAAQLVPINSQAGSSYTLVLGDAGKTVLTSSSSSVTVTVPPNASVAFPTGTILAVGQVGTGQVTLVAGGGVTLNTPNTLLTRARYSTLGLLKTGTDTWLVSGDSG